MHRLILLSFVFSSLTCVGLAQEDCKVMTECGDDLLWKSWPDGIFSGRPGKRGAPGSAGPPGQKGEPGKTFTIQPDDESPDPKMHFLGHTTTWNTAKTYCQVEGKTLCRSDELCINNNGGRQMIHDPIPGDHWVPVLDGHNKWMQAGDSRRFTCYTHTETHSGGMATWGTKITPQPHKGYVYCCGKKFAGMRYGYIGKAATYASSKKHCGNQKKRLCYSGEICSNNSPIFGVIARDAWVAVKDRENEWLQIGNVRTCSNYSVIFSGTPSWGIRTDGILYDYLGFVLCCPFE